MFICLHLEVNNSKEERFVIASSFVQSFANLVIKKTYKGKECPSNGLITQKLSVHCCHSFVSQQTLQLSGWVGHGFQSELSHSVSLHTSGTCHFGGRTNYKYILLFKIDMAYFKALLLVLWPSKEKLPSFTRDGHCCTLTPLTLI